MMAHNNGFFLSNRFATIQKLFGFNKTLKTFWNLSSKLHTYALFGRVSVELTSRFAELTLGEILGEAPSLLMNFWDEFLL